MTNWGAGRTAEMDRIATALERIADALQPHGATPTCHCGGDATGHPDHEPATPTLQTATINTPNPSSS